MNARALRIARLVLVTLAGAGALWVALAITFEGERQPAPLLVVDASDELDNDLVVTGQSIEIDGRVKGGVLVFGGDVTLRGSVGGDVATIGGSINQTGGHIGGDVLVVGGHYNPDDSQAEGRVDGTVNIFTGNSQSLRDFFSNPAREFHEHGIFCRQHLVSSAQVRTHLALNASVRTRLR